jgi:hypothetical protein
MLDRLNQILKFPERSSVNKKITKSFFKKNFDLTAADRKLLEGNSLISQIDWLYSLKPDNVNIKGYSNDRTSFEEIQVIAIFTSDVVLENNKQKIIEFVQKFIPYHILLVVYNEKEFVFNTCDKLINQNDISKRTIVKSFDSEIISINELTEKQQAFIGSLAFENLDKDNLKTLYESFSKSIISLQAANFTGEFINRPIERSKQDILDLDTIAKLEGEIILLQNQANKEFELSAQIKINTEVQFRRKELDKLKRKLKE